MIDELATTLGTDDFRNWRTGTIPTSGKRWAVRWYENGRRRFKTYATRELAEQVLARIVRDAAVCGAGLPRDYDESPNLEALAATCDLPKMTLYQCTRHTFASQWVMNGGSLEMLAKIMGHSSTSTTQHNYAHLAPDFFGAKAFDMVAVDLTQSDRERGKSCALWR